MVTHTLRDKRDHTTQRILEAATSIFSEVGFAGARVDEIAKRAGVNKATIYYHIGDKQALYTQVIRTLFEDAADRFEHNVSKAQSPVDKLKFYIQTVADAMERHPELAAIMLWEQAAGGLNFPEIVAHSLARILTVISRILQEGTEKGVFIETEPFIVHMMIIGTSVFCKMSAPIRAKSASLAGIHQLEDPALDINTANEIETLVLNAVLKK